MSLSDYSDTVELLYASILWVILGERELMASSMTWTIPSPSHRPMEPPTSERKLARLNVRKSVLVTSTLLEKVRASVEKLLSSDLSKRCFVSVRVVVQGRGQSESWLPTTRSNKVTPEAVPESK